MGSRGGAESLGEDGWRWGEEKEVRPEVRLFPPGCPFLAMAVSEHKKRPRRNRFLGWEESDVDFNTLNLGYLEILEDPHAQQRDKGDLRK